MQDLTLPSFAYLRLPLAMAAVAFLIGAVGLFLWKNQRAFISAVIMMIVFYQAARLAMTKFDPYLSSHALAVALEKAPEGKLIAYEHYYPTSSVFFYTNRTALLWNGKTMNLIYGAYAPGAPDVFLDDRQFAELWRKPERNYLILPEEEMEHLKSLTDPSNVIILEESGGKYLVTNQAVK
jgi:hypothetical protein